MRFACLLVLILPPVLACAARDRDPERDQRVPAVAVSTKLTAHLSRQKPFFDARSRVAEYAGPGRETPRPEGIDEVKIGWFGPADANHPAGGDMWRAAMLAVEEANLAGGYNGTPFRLVASWSENPWGTGVKDVARLVYDEGVWAITGAPDGASAHLVEQVVAKARLTFVSPVATDKAVNLANVAWTFSCTPGDDVQAAMLAQAVASQGAAAALVVVTCTDHDSRALATELLASLRRHGTFPIMHLQFRPGCPNLEAHVESIRQAGAAAVVLIADAHEAGRFACALHKEGLTLPVFGGPAMGRSLFARTAGDCAEGVAFPLLWHPPAAGERSTEFARRFQQRFGIHPDYTAAYTYDAVGLLIAAIRSAGLNRALIRDAIGALSPFPGVTGQVIWDPTGRNLGPIQLGVIQNRQTVVGDPASGVPGQIETPSPAG